MANFIDNIIEFFSPEAGYRRQAFRNAIEDIRNYDAAGYGRHNNNWRVVNESGEETDRFSRDIVRARARDLERNSDIMNATVGAFTRNVYGRGFRLRAMTQDQDLNKQIEDAWERWCEPENCDVTGTQSFNSIMRMAVRRKKIDGGILILKTVTEGGYLQYKLQLVEVDELDETAVTPHQKENKVIGGIEYNAYNRPVGYYIKKYDYSGMESQNAVYVSAENVIFYMTKTRPSQLREMSDMAPTMTRIRNINEFLSAIAIKERILACFSVFIKKQTPASGIGARDSKINSAGKHDYQGKTVTPGLIQYLDPGDDVQAVNPSGQATDATNFTKQQLRMVGAGQGLSYETVSRDMSETNYSSARQGIIEDDLTYAEDENAVVEVMDSIFRTFMAFLVLEGKVDIRDFWSNPQSYTRHKWIKAPKPWIDPVKEANANKIALQTGQKTWADITAENGREWKEQIDEMAEIVRYGEEAGIDMKGIIYGQKTAGQNGNAR